MHELPLRGRQLLHADQRSSAIVLLGELAELDAKEAEQRIDHYLNENPPIRPRGAAIVRANRTNALIWLTLIILMALLGVIFAL